jgi:hypothetical protein
MMSIQAFFLRTFLRLRKAGMDWDAPVEKWRTRADFPYLLLPIGLFAGVGGDFFGSLLGTLLRMLPGIPAPD